jgi:DNA-binding transcriptional LysR family regulator
MNIRQLECFSTLAEELSFTKAAAKLHIAQPPLSRQIKMLEDELGVMLFDRNKRTVRLTAEGAYFSKEVGSLFTHIQKATKQVKEIKNGHSGSISVAYVGAAMHSVLPEMLRKFCSSHQQVQVKLFEMDNTQQVEALEKGTIDIGFLRSKQSSEEVTLQEVYREPFMLVTPWNIKLASVKSADLHKIKEMPFISFPLACAPDMVRSIHNVLPKLGLAPAVIHESSQINTFIRIVESGLGYAILPLGVKRSYKVKIRTYELPASREKALLYVGVGKNRNSGVVKKFLEVVNCEW